MDNFINRDFKLSEDEDWRKNVQPHLSNYKESMPVYYKDEINKETYVLGWNIQMRYE